MTDELGHKQDIHDGNAEPEADCQDPNQGSALPVAIADFQLGRAGQPRHKTPDRDDPKHGNR
jgi:hypothetical protein